MSLTLPRWGRTADHVVIRGAEAIAYRVPMDLTSDSTDRTTAPFNYLISLVGVTDSGRKFSGLAEAQSRPNQTDDSHELSWPFLDEQLERLIGAVIDVRNPIDAVHMRTSALEDAAGLAAHGQSVRFRATIAGVESALLDLAAKVRGLTLADLLGREAWTTNPFPPLLRRLEPESVARHFHPVRSNNPDDVRLLADSAEAGLAHLRQTAAIRRALRRRSVDAPIWVNFRGALSVDEARDLIRTCVEWIGRRELPPTVVLQHLLPRNDQEESPALQSYADELARAHDVVIDVRILPYNAGPAETARMLQSANGTIRTINLRPGQIGGILRTRALIEDTVARAPG